MNKEKLLKEIMKLPKIETNNPINTINNINIDDLMSAVDRLNKVPTYDELQQENKRLKATIKLYKGALKSEHEATHRVNDLEDNWNELKNALQEIYKNCPTYERGALKFMRDKMQKLEKKYKNLWDKKDNDEKV